MKHSIANTSVASSSVASPAVRPDLWRLGLRQLLPLAVVALFAWMLRHKLAELDIPAIGNALSSVSPAQWALAALASAGSFWAVGRYDSVLHRQLGTGIDTGAARRSGAAAIALAQTLGFGPVTGALVRWRMLPELSLWQASRVSVAVSLSFLAGWSVVVAIAVLIFQPPLPLARPLAAAALGVAVFLGVVSLWPPGWLARFSPPSLRAILAVVMLAAMDTVLAGTALYILLPAGVEIAPGVLLTAYLIALGAGLLGATPGGVGPFEMCMLTQLPTVDPASLLAAIVAFRAVYYLLPAALAAALLIRGPRGPARFPAPKLTRFNSPYLPPKIEALLYRAPRAEANLLRQGNFALLESAAGRPTALAAPLGQSLVMLSDPLQEKCDPGESRAILERAAKARFRQPALYKCGTRMAASARRAGWSVLPVAREAWICPRDFSTEGAKRSQLRRLLRKATDAGVHITEGGRRLPLQQMEQLSRRWVEAHGAERGFSMGVFCPQYVSCQRVFLAWSAENELLGFVTFHESRDELTLDLMRQGDTTPAGTMQALVVHALQTAARLGVPRLSLAAAPCEQNDAGTPWLLSAMRSRFTRASGTGGLTRFKSAFAPNWDVLYIAAPTHTGLVLAGLDILRQITAPPCRCKATRKGGSPGQDHGSAVHS
ncbi:phosphatidylglycerol lysyltransferase domain-containing protein [Candidatus Halocynthiibacter alkanivorans]|uniref:phosphatidylglycerol lysyltransferase domain-containing protein n=1 Tax=Candidatus Halocynthiibacter alkanivorans TaxID=2267619 RepID=UPI000DF334E9|nr:phosphatidylglycerol lysyltransferase domain-containing protein [Candidatus Halocynthiibacter alkanivorans]